MNRNKILFIEPENSIFYKLIEQVIKKERIPNADVTSPEDSGLSSLSADVIICDDLGGLCWEIKSASNCQEFILYSKHPALVEKAREMGITASLKARKDSIAEEVYEMIKGYG